MTSKQRAFLRAKAVELDTIVMVGKGGMSPEIIRQTAEAILVRELIKGKVLTETSPLSPREVAEALAQATDSAVVQVIGSKFVLYKRNPKDPKIRLPR